MTDIVFLKLTNVLPTMKCINNCLTDITPKLAKLTEHVSFDHKGPRTEMPNFWIEYQKGRRPKRPKP